MADLRITNGSTAPTPVQPSARAEAVRAAQRAFFDAALNQAQAPAAGKRPSAAASPESVQSPGRASMAETNQSTPADRMLRPGSFLDIKV